METPEERAPEKYSIHALSKEELTRLERSIRRTWMTAVKMWCKTVDQDTKDFYEKTHMFTDLLVDYLCIEDLMNDLEHFLDLFEEEYTLVSNDEKITY